MNLTNENRAHLLKAASCLVEAAGHLLLCGVEHLKAEALSLTEIAKGITERVWK